MAVARTDVTTLDGRVKKVEGNWGTDPATLTAQLASLQTRVLAIESRTDSPAQIKADLDAIAVRIAAIEAKLPA